MRRGPAGRPRGDDSGQILVLLAGLLAVGVLLVAVVTDQSRLFLERRALLAAADAAAQHAAQALDEAAYYERGPTASSATLPLSPSQAQAAVRSYADQARLPARFAGFEVTDVRIEPDTGGGDAVVVTLAAQVTTPVRRVLGGGASPVTVAATARARAHVEP